MRLDYRTGASEERGKTHKRKLMSNRIKFRKRSIMMRSIMVHAVTDLACVLSE